MADDPNDESPVQASQASQGPILQSAPTSPTYTRRQPRRRSRRHSLSEDQPDETTSLLRPAHSRVRIQSASGTSRRNLSRNHSYHGTPSSPRTYLEHLEPTWTSQFPLTCFNPLASGSTYTPKYHDRHASFGQRLIQALADRPESRADSRWPIFQDERVWYDQFTSTDWFRDSIADSYRVKSLQNRKDFWGRLIVLFDGAQGWILSAVVGFLVAVVAYCVDVAETTVFDFKDGYCKKGWYHREKVLAYSGVALHSDDAS